MPIEVEIKRDGNNTGGSIIVQDRYFGWAELTIKTETDADGTRSYSASLAMTREITKRILITGYRKVTVEADELKGLCAIADWLESLKDAFGGLKEDCRETAFPYMVHEHGFEPYNPIHRLLSALTGRVDQLFESEPARAKAAA